MVGAEQAVQHFPAHVIRQHPVVVGRRPRGVREVRDPHVGPEIGEHPRDQAQVIVLHRGAERGAFRPPARPAWRARLGRRARVLGQRAGERAVVGSERLPLPLERDPEMGPVRRVVEHVVHEPQRGVRHRVVRPVEDRRGNVEHAHGGAARRPVHAEAPVRRPADGGAVGVAQRGADPEEVTVVGDGGEPGYQAASPPPGRQPPVITECERHRPPVGCDENPPAGCSCAHDGAGYRESLRRARTGWPGASRPVRPGPCVLGGRCGLARCTRHQQSGLQYWLQLHNAHPEGWRDRPCEAPATITVILCPRHAREAPRYRRGLAKRPHGRGHSVTGANSGPRPHGRWER